MRSDFIKRTATSAVIVIVLIGCTLLHPVSFFILFTVIVAIGQAEFYRIALRDGRKPQVLTGIFFGITVFVTNFCVASGYTDSKILAIYLPIVIMLTIIELFRDSVHPVSNIAYAIFGAVYVAMPFGLVNYLVFNPVFNNDFNSSILIAFFVMIWASDSGAYIIGSMIGKNKLFKRISPKKTWEGFFGGALFSLIAAWLASLFVKEIALFHWFVIAVITVVFGTFGDLLESLLKRKVNIKDSGAILPGHGGILDRFDSLLMAAPMVFVYLLFIS